MVLYLHTPADGHMYDRLTYSLASSAVTDTSGSLCRRIEITCCATQSERIHATSEAWTPLRGGVLAAGVYHCHRRLNGTATVMSRRVLASCRASPIPATIDAITPEPQSLPVLLSRATAYSCIQVDTVLSILHGCLTCFA